MNILITGAGSPIAISVYKSLVKQGYNIFMADTESISAGLYLVSSENQFLVPSSRSKQYIPFLLNLCADRKIDLIVPTSDGELIPMAKHIDDFNAVGCKVMVSPLESLKKCQDKYLLMQSCENRVLLAEYEPLEDFLISPDFSKKKWIVKPRIGSGARYMHIVKNIEELAAISHLGTQNYIVQEFLEGKEYNVDIMIDKGGKVCSAVATEKIKSDAGVEVISRVVKKASIIQYAISVAECLDLRYSINIEMINTYDRGPLLIEVNPRFSGSLNLVIEAGANIPLMCALNLLHDESVDVISNYKEIEILRYYEEKFFAPVSLIKEETDIDNPGEARYVSPF